MAGMADSSAKARSVGKSATAYRTISEVSDELDVPQHVLRFWETKFSQVRPLKRGGGRRYYRPEDVGLLRRIQKLLYQEGYTIKGVQRLLREGKAGAEGRASELAAERVSSEDHSPWAETGADDEQPPGEFDEHGAGLGAGGAALETAAAPEAAEDVGSALPPRLRGELSELLSELKRLREMLRDRDD